MDPKKALENIVQSRVDMRHLSASILKNFGGMEGLADALKRNYDALPDGDKTRVTLLKNIVDLFEKQAAVSSVVDELTQEDIEREIERLVRSKDGPADPGATSEPAGAQAEDPA